MPDIDVRIYRPARTAMQAGYAKARKWVVEFEPRAPRTVEPLMGWTASPDTMSQVRLAFDSLEEAIAYAEKRGYRYVVDTPHRVRRRPKSYADNFRYNRPPIR